MKRYGNLWGQICERTNIELAADNALKSKKMTRERQRFIADRQHLLDELQASLVNETYHFSPLKSFTVYEPKERIINHPPFYPDKILHHCLMNVVKPIIMEKLTADAYGSIKGRGVTMAADKLKRVLANHPQWYFLQIDCQKFYPSINHDVCKQAVRRAIKCPKTLKMLDAIIDIHPQGLAIGVYPSQYLANLVLAKIDHWAKEVLHAEYYFRYMDDIVLVLPSKEMAKEALERITTELSNLQLTVKNNWRIAPVTYGIDFIGYKFFPTHTQLRKRIKVAMQRRVRQLNKQGVSDAVFKQQLASHFGWCKHGDCRHLLRTTLKDKMYLFENNMEFKRLSEIREEQNWFGLSKDKRVSIKELFGRDIVFFEYLTATIRGEEKVVVKFAYPDKPEDYHMFITRSDVMKARLERDKDVMPFVATIKQVKNYTAYE